MEDIIMWTYKDFAETAPDVKFYKYYGSVWGQK